MLRPAKTHGFIVCLLLASVATAALPEPPKQHEPWTPPSGYAIPDYVVKVSVELFAAGLADPRGASYREIELAAGSSDPANVKTHGWVFGGHFAVCWNGLVYPLQTVGAPADLDQDVRTIAHSEPWSGRTTIGNANAVRSADLAFWTNMELGQLLTPGSIALLLRLGRPDLAAELWQAPETQRSFLKTHEANERQWFATAGRAWLGMAFWRLIGSRDRDDDRDAVDVGQSLLIWDRNVQEVLDRMGMTSKPDPVRWFLDPVSPLLADSERRLKETPRSRLGPVETRALPAKPQGERIAELIDRMEDIRAVKASLPGPLDFASEPICALLIREGEAAVDALLNVYEHDQRLTRTSDFGRPWFTDRTPVPVSEAARIILANILRAPGLVRSSTPRELRAWWEKNKAKNPLDRAFLILADDHAKPAQWTESADTITLRSDVTRSGAWTQFSADACTLNHPVPAARGEELRTRSGPSVSGLLAKRIADLVASKEFDAACSIAFMAFLWEPKSSLAGLQVAGAQATCRASGLVTAARISLGDRQGAAAWGAAIRERAAQPALQLSDLMPLWMFPDDPEFAETAEWLFARPESPLSPKASFQFIKSPLLTIPVYRRAVEAALGDESVMGKATRSADGVLSYTLGSGRGGGGSPTGTDPRRAPPGEQRPVRVQDMTAWQLSKLEGAPTFELDWPLADKDAAIIEIAAFLNGHAKELRAFPTKLQDSMCFKQDVFLAH